jgi:hypothetical protein
MNTTFLVIFIYLIFGILLNIFGFLARKIKYEFSRLNFKQKTSEIIEDENVEHEIFTKQKLLMLKIVLRFLTVVFFPIFMAILIITDLAEGKNPFRIQKLTLLKNKEKWF